MRPPTKLQVFANFWPQKCYNPLSTPLPTLRMYLRHTIFCSPSWKMKLKGLHSADGAEIQEAVTDELKKARIEEFSAAFQKLYDRAKACIYANRAYFERKKCTSLPRASSIFKKVSPKTSGPQSVKQLFVCQYNLFSKKKSSYSYFLHIRLTRRPN